MTEESELELVQQIRAILLRAFVNSDFNGAIKEVIALVRQHRARERPIGNFCDEIRSLKERVTVLEGHQSDAASAPPAAPAE
jgi:hypothetical protein